MTINLLALAKNGIKNTPNNWFLASHFSHGAVHGITKNSSAIEAFGLLMQSSTSYTCIVHYLQHRPAAGLIKHLNNTHRIARIASIELGARSFTVITVAVVHLVVRVRYPNQISSISNVHTIKDQPRVQNARESALTFTKHKSQLPHRSTFYVQINRYAFVGAGFSNQKKN